MEDAVSCAISTSLCAATVRRRRRSEQRWVLHLSSVLVLVVQKIDPAPPRTKSHKSGLPSRAEVSLSAGEALKWSSRIVGAAPALPRSSPRPTARARTAGEATIWEFSEDGRWNLLNLRHRNEWGLRARRKSGSEL
jgi:hypothetical protein